MPTFHRFLSAVLLTATAAAQAQGGDPLNTPASSRLRIALLPAESGLVTSAEDGGLFQLRPSAAFAPGALIGRRLKLQMRNLLTANDRLELGRAPKLTLGTQLLGGAEPMWAQARNPQPSSPYHRLQLSYGAGPWSFAVGTSPVLRDGTLQIRLSYSVRY
jgi:hypothetical protein